MEDKKTITNHSGFSIRDHHWGQYKLVQFKTSGRNPETIKEWLVAFWNWDIFWGPVPVLKVIATIAWIIAWVAGRLT